ncbi:hypothetical protein [Moheibacter lacus]|uniref:Uncharacterized protein n=1 Tax=Moheibacter lacus TaxID=2745851 RepID=A0A838ZSP9_9FLAO|nr:hypothetical protein [Moheibacter lacus]MBA5630008.1 hypothetical protein [Moheibacter lacus]
MRYIKKIILKIREEEQKSDLSPQCVIASSRQIASVLLDKLELMKGYILENGFGKSEEEIEFFKKIKPEVQGKLIFYNKKL